MAEQGALLAVAVLVQPEKLASRTAATWPSWPARQQEMRRDPSFWSRTPTCSSGAHEVGSAKTGCSWLAQGRSRMCCEPPPRASAEREGAAFGTAYCPGSCFCYLYLWFCCAKNVVMCTGVLAGHGAEAVLGRLLSCLGGDAPERQEPRQGPYHPLFFRALKEGP